MVIVKLIVVLDESEQYVCRLAKNLYTRKGSRRGNAGNRLELQVLTQLHHVP